MTRRRFMELILEKGGSACGPVSCKLTGLRGRAAMWPSAYPHPYRGMAQSGQDGVPPLRKLSDYRELIMADGMDNRGKAFESKWAHDAELRLQVEARRNRA